MPGRAFGRTKSDKPIDDTMIVNTCAAPESALRDQHPLGRRVLWLQGLAAICPLTGFPLASTVETASQAEVPMVPTLLDTLASRGIVPGVAVLDKGYDATTIYDTCEARGIRPIFPLDLQLGHFLRRGGMANQGYRPGRAT